MADRLRPDGVSFSRHLVAQRFPDARAAWLGGSVAAGTETATSDLDITVLLDGPPAPYRASEVVDDWPVEFFVQTEESLLDFSAQDRRRRRPTAMRLVGSAIVLHDRDGSGERLQKVLHQMDKLGPPTASPDEMEHRRYAVSDLLADLESASTGDEALTVAATLLREAGDLLLAAHRRWSGSGKWLLREIDSLDRDRDTSHGAQLIRGLRSAATHDTRPMRQAVRDILDQSGGPLFNGYHRSAKQSVTVHIRPAGIDEAGMPELLALAVGDKRRCDDAVQQYRNDSAAMLLGATVDGDVVGILGYTVSDSAVTVLHIATAARLRRAGVGTALLGGLRRAVPTGLPIIAETDGDGVEFYAAHGFTVASLGEKYPGVERFSVRRAAPRWWTPP
jgi:GNAT superfamily N-acetyltransferase/predicted nucleotidyltransferase